MAVLPLRHRLQHQTLERLGVGVEVVALQGGLAARVHRQAAVVEPLQESRRASQISSRPVGS